MPDLIRRLAGPAQLTNASATIYTAPASTAVTIREILICNTTGGAVTFTASIGVDAAGTRIYNAMSIPANSSTIISCMTVLNAGETLRAYASANSSLTINVSGVESS